MVQGELLERAIRYLADHDGATSAELARHVFGGEAFALLLETLRDERLAFEDGRWRLRQPAEEWAVLEVLASGPNPSRHRVVEVAARRASRDFSALIWSAKPVPRLLRRLGVPERPEQAGDEWLTLESAAAELRTFLAGATVVGLGYVPAFLTQLLGPCWPAIDLLRLVEAAGFGGRPDPVTLARHLGLRAPVGRRAKALLDFSQALFEHLRGGRPLAELRGLAEPGAAAAPSYSSLPSQPGVYVMTNREGQALYVGKSVDLRRRVGSYLRSPIAVSRNLHDLMQRTREIEVIPASSELEALLVEDELIRQWLPPFNTQRQRAQRRRYLRLSVHEAFPRLTLCAAPMADGAIYFGPFRHTTAATRLRDLLADVLRLRTCRRQLPPRGKPRPPCDKAASGECLAPCLPGPPLTPYGVEVDLARRLLTSSPEDFRRTLRRLLRERGLAAGDAPRLKRRLQALRVPSAADGG